MPSTDEPAFNGAHASEESSPKTGIDEAHIRAVPAVVEFDETTGFALDLMNREGVDELPVVSPGTVKLLGIVTRHVLEEQCRGLGHDPDRCRVRSHISTDVAYCFRDQPLDDDVLRRSGSDPVVVVDSHLQPVGFLQPRSAAAGSVVAIDPDDDARAIYAALLEELGYEVETAATLDDVLGRLVKDPPDLVILEPLGDDRVIRRIAGARTAGNGSCPPILVATSWVDQTSTDAVLSAGAARCLPKPVTAASLEEAVTALLGTGDGATMSEPDRDAATRILVVDDDAEVRDLIAGVLEKEGYEVRTEPNGRAGVATAASWHPGLVLMDLAMPELDGWNARRLLERGKSTADIPVVLVSGSCGEVDREEILREGFADLVRKPFTPEQLLWAVEDVLAGKPEGSRRPPARRPISPRNRGRVEIRTEAS